MKESALWNKSPRRQEPETRVLGQGQIGLNFKYMEFPHLSFHSDINNGFKTKEPILGKEGGPYTEEEK